MPKRSSRSDDPIITAKRALDHIIAKHDPESSVAFEVEVRGGRIVHETLKQNPKASLRFSESLLKDVPDGPICAVKLRTSTESYAIINLNSSINNGDLVLLGTGRIDEVMRVQRQPEGDWKYYPLRGTDRPPWRVTDLFAVWGKVVKIVDDPA